MSERDAIEQQAAQWLMQRSEPGWSRKDQAALDQWLGQSMAHKAAFWRLEAGWARVMAVEAPSRPRYFPAWSIDWRRLGRPMALAASILLPLMAIGLFYLANRPPPADPARYVTRIGQRGALALADGSRVELNTNSQVRVDQTARQRTMWLDRGEGYFEVAHDPARPFVLHVGARVVTVLGTKFVVRRDGDDVIVSVVDGRVRLDSDGVPGHAAIVTRGDIAITDGASTLIESDAIERIDRGLAWRTGTLSLEQSTVAEAAAEFNRYNRRQLVITDPAIADLRIGGAFKVNNVEGFARLLHKAYGVEVTFGEREIKISGR